MAVISLHNRCSGVILKSLKINLFIYRVTSTRSPETVFLEKCIENPIIVKSHTKEVDMIGPPDPLSNLRPIIRQRLLHETSLQQRLRKFQDETQEWNQTFWTNHNTQFNTEKHKYIESFFKHKEEKRTLTAEEMSQFYKTFLDEHWKTHVTYNFQWYRRNFHIALLSLRVKIEQMVPQL